VKTARVTRRARVMRGRKRTDGPRRPPSMITRSHLIVDAMSAVDIVMSPATSGESLTTHVSSRQRFWAHIFSKCRRHRSACLTCDHHSSLRARRSGSYLESI
jgi:hypothetical protein